MSDDQDQLRELLDRVNEISERLGVSGPRPDDPLKASRWDTPIFWHISELRDSLHSLRNFTQVLTGLIEQVGRKLDRNASISSENFQAISKLTDIISASSRRIEDSIGAVVRDQPLLMRDLPWVDTNATEVHLTLLMGGEALLFLAGGSRVLNSAMFSSVSYISSVPQFWGLTCMAMAGIGFAGFISRRRRIRLASLFIDGVYLIATGILSLLYAGPVLGLWLPHLIYGATCAWIIFRGPSSAI